MGSGAEAGPPERDRAEASRLGRGRSRPPARVRVTSPRMGARPRPPSLSGTRDIDEQTGLGEVYMRSLLRAQLRLGMTVVIVSAVAIGILPLLFAAEPRLAQLRLLTVPVPWWLIGVGLYPVFVALAWWYVRASERAERDFADIVERR